MIEKIFYFLFDPKSEGYTFLKTFIYSLGYVAVIFLSFVFLRKKIKTDIDERLIIHSYFLALPFIALRVLEDYSFIQSALFVTPWIEIFYLKVFLTSLFILIKILKIDNYEKFSFIFSTFIFFILLLPHKRFNFFALFLYFLIGLFSLFLFFIVKIDYFDKLVIFTQFYESIITVINVTFFRFYEQHILSRFLLEVSPFIFIVIKMLFAFFFLRVVDFCTKDKKDLKNFIKLTFSVLGFSVGMRNSLQAIFFG